MKAFDAYKCYLAVTRHFKDPKYDFHKYNGGIRASADAFLRRPDQRHFLKISRTSDPLTHIVGNVLFNPDPWVGGYSEMYAQEMIKYQTNGIYEFKQQLGLLNPQLTENFVVDINRPIPYILKLLTTGAISIHTACVFEQVMQCDVKWSKKPQYVIFSALSQKIVKAAPFFNIDSAKYKAIIIEHFDNERVEP